MAEPAAVMDRSAVPAACPQQSPGPVQLDHEKSSTALLISGLFLGLVGIALTTLGWQHYNVNTAFDWTQLLGPFLISVGGTFVLTGACRFGLVSCMARNGDIPESARHAFTLSHRGMLHSTVVCVSPSYNCMQQPSSGVSRDAPVTASEPPPHYDTICTGGSAPEGTEANSRDQKTLGEVRSEAETSHGSTSPPAYEDIYPSTN